MTVYVDQAFIPWRRGLWCHLTADTQDELHMFATRIGLRRAWYQTCKHRCAPVAMPCVHWHYDVNEGRRAAAVLAGAVEIDRHRLVEIIRARRTAEGES